MRHFGVGKCDISEWVVVLHKNLTSSRIYDIIRLRHLCVGGREKKYGFGSV